MRRFLVFCCVAGLCYGAGEVSAQQSPISFGLKAGVNMSTVAGEDAKLDPAKFIPAGGGIPQIGALDLTAEPQSKTQFCGGVYVAYTFNSILAAQVEAMYSGKGVSYDRDFSYSIPFGGVSASGNFKADAEMAYIDVPLLLKVTAPIEGSMKPYLLLGPSFGFLADKSTSAKAHIKVNFNGQTTETDVPVPVSFDFKSVDIGATFGGGISFRMMGTAIGAEVRYTLGFESAVDSMNVDTSGTGGEGQTSTELDMKNRALGITAFMEFYF